MSLVKNLKFDVSNMKQDILPYFTKNDSKQSWLHNRYPPGLGKSRNTIESIFYSNENWAIVIPNHKMIYGKHNMVWNCWKNSISYQNMLGKTRYVTKSTNKELKIANDINLRLVDTEKEGFIGKKLCLQPSGREYVPGCTDCVFSEKCLYNRLKENAENKQIIFTPIHTLAMYQYKNIVFDESIEQNKLIIKTYTQKQLDKFGIILDDIKNVKIAGKNVIYYNNVSIKESKYNNNDNEENYFLNLFLNSCFKDKVNLTDSNGNNPRILYTGIMARVNSKGTINLFGEYLRFMPTNFKSIIYNCATISTKLLNATINTTDPVKLALTFGFNNHVPFNWDIKESKNFNIKKLKNPIFQFKFNWTKKSSEKFLDNLQQFLLKYYDRKKVLIITKLRFENELLQFVDLFDTIDINCVHYNAGRGFNSMEINDEEDQYDLVIVYGRFGFDRFTRDLWKQIGYTDELLDDMEINEILQALHRCRPLKHPQIPIMIMSDKKLLSSMKLKKHPIKAFNLVMNDEDVFTIDSKQDKEEKMNCKLTSSDYKHYKQFKEFLQE